MAETGTSHSYTQCHRQSSWHHIWQYIIHNMTSMFTFTHNNSTACMKTSRVQQRRPCFGPRVLGNTHCTGTGRPGSQGHTGTSAGFQHWLCSCRCFCSNHCRCAGYSWARWSRWGIDMSESLLAKEDTIMINAMMQTKLASTMHDYEYTVAT